MMEMIITYLIYCIALVGTVFCFLYFQTRREKQRLQNRYEVLKIKCDILRHFVEKGYETDKVDLNNFLN